MSGPEEVGDIDADRDDQQPDDGGLDAEKAGPQILPDKPGEEPPDHPAKDDAAALPRGQQPDR
jgi:hypothetical protein